MIDILTNWCLQSINKFSFNFLDYAMRISTFFLLITYFIHMNLQFYFRRDHMLWFLRFNLKNLWLRKTVFFQIEFDENICKINSKSVKISIHDFCWIYVWILKLFLKGSKFSIFHFTWLCWENFRYFFIFCPLISLQNPLLQTIFCQTF